MLWLVCVDVMLHVHIFCLLLEASLKLKKKIEVTVTNFSQVINNQTL